MTRVFVATLGKGRGTWGHVARLIQEEQWDKILLISNEFCQENFKPAKEVSWVLVNSRTGFEAIKDSIKAALPEGEILISLISGIGKEHMALLAALREAGRDYKVVTLTGNGTKTY
ncbi:MAG: hypothetical protein QXK06_02430 [Candidatus Diapherotrites archaeon]